MVAQQELKNAEITVRDEKGSQQIVRIDSVMIDPNDSEIQLYGLSVKDAVSGEWHNMCQPGPDGLVMGFPLSGEWTPDGRHVRSDSFLLTCTAGAIGKCVRFGYKPWKTDPLGNSLWDYHQACTRMVRADYCGNGVSFTRDGTRIDYFDRLKINVPDTDQGMTFEAAWGVDGAVCVAHTRIPEIIKLDALLKLCPAKFERLDSKCIQQSAIELTTALVGNKSFEK